VLAHLDTINGNINDIAFKVPTRTQPKTRAPAKSKTDPTQPDPGSAMVRSTSPGNSTANTQVPQ